LNSIAKPLIIAVAVAAIAVVLFVALKPNDSDSDSGGETVTNSAEPTAAGGSTGATGTTGSKPKPKPNVPTVVFKDGKPVGGVLGIEVNKGDQIRFRVKSDIADEVHVHGFDIGRDVAAGGTVSLAFAADITGIYEAEMEDQGIQIVELQIDP
jgi:hypothetical protein